MHRLLLIASLTIAAVVPAHAEEVNCDIREVEYSDDRTSDRTRRVWDRCKLASSFTGCIRPEDIATPDNPNDPPCLVLDTSATLCNGMGSFDVNVFLTTSNVNFDCQGATIDQRYGVDTEVRRSGFRTPYEESVSDITIRNCTLQNIGRYGFDLKRFFRNESDEVGGVQELDGPMIGHERITIENAVIDHPRQMGIYVGQKSRDFSFDQVLIDHAFIGIYLEAGSTGTHVNHAVIYDSYDRGGIHVDSSAGNLIENSLFAGNHDGGILMYKNCGELTGQICPVRRELGADNNVIRNNEFWHDRVSVGYRQFKLYSFSPDGLDQQWCEGIDALGYWRDHASNNVIYGNQFHDEAKLDIQDAPNVVYGNIFYESPLEIGSGDPWGDDPIDYSGAIVENYFADGWLGHHGSFSRAYEDVDVSRNFDENGDCIEQSEPLLACGGQGVWRWSTAGCYGAPRNLDAATCNEPPVLGVGSPDLIVPVDAWGGRETDLLLYDRGAGTGRIYRRAGDGEMTWMFSWTGWRNSWDAIVAGDFDGDGAEDELFFYDRTAGEAEVYRIEQTGEIARLRSFSGWSHTWDRIVAVDLPATRHTDLFFYDRALGRAQLRTVTGSASMPVLRTFSGLATTWDLFVAGDFDGDRRADDLVWYDRSRGVGSFYSFYPTGSLYRFAHYTSWSQTWSQIAPVELDATRTDLAFYDAGAGLGSFYRVTDAGAMTHVRTDDGWRTTWDTIVAGDVDVNRPGANELFFHDGYVWQLYSVGATGAMTLLTEGLPPDAGEAPDIGGLF